MNKQKELMELLRGVKNVLDEHNIKFWLECGTLLGAIRDGAFIPWEKDIDFGVWQDQFPKNIKNSVAEAFIEKGFRVWVTEDCMTVKNSDESFADINSYHLDGNNAIVSRYDPNNIIGVLSYMFHKTLLSPYYYKINPFKSQKEFIRSILVMISRILPAFLRKRLAALLITIYDKAGTKAVPWVVPKHYISELSTTDFLGMEFNIPEKAEEYLAFRYGEDWRTPRKDWLTTRDDGAVNKKNI
ncbi:MAG: LicD family protein [Planctomycetes bacterium]|nr:LicD family protein [Planctomycetota bacterium]